jgi:hypothetical protein
VVFVLSDVISSCLGGPKFSLNVLNSGLDACLHVISSTDAGVKLPYFDIVCGSIGGVNFF